MTSTNNIILIAEDDEDDFLLTRDAFREAGLRTRLIWVRDGEELMDYLCRRKPYADPVSSPRPALILLDLNMPRKDGREALKEIKSDPGLSSIPILTLTTSNAMEDIRYTYGLGVNSFIRKPVGFNRFLELVKAIDQYWFRVVRLPNPTGEDARHG